jgi:prepilin-type N-terminal cleavage/methylation domain-containing protein
MERESTMKTSKLKLRKGYSMIEILVVLSISLVSLTMIKLPQSLSHQFIMDAHIFSNMMKSIYLNESIQIIYQNHHLNTFHPTHAFARSYTKQIGNIEIVFYIGRGYYAIKRRI